MIRSLTFLLLLAFLAQTAMAQLGPADDEGFGGEAADSGGMKISGGVALELSDNRLQLEVTDVEAIDDDGVTPIDPLNDSAANNGIDYFTRETFFGLRGSLEAKISKGIFLGGKIRLGALTLDLVNEIDPGSVFVNPNGDPRNETATSWSTIAFGLGLNGGYDADKIRIGIEWDLFYGSAEFEDSRFFDDRIEGDYSILTNRFSATVGYDFGFARPFAGAGLLIYSGSVDLEEPNDATPKTYKADFAAQDIFKLLLGVELMGGKHVWARASISILAETTFELAVGIRFP
ncbi:MAG: hypothetical protein ACYTFG_04930 [Planctomycetota bacterium]|jgi:hypothetical protein